MVLDALLDAGARLAMPGEFTQRAFLSGRIDLAQAEAVLAVIQATTAGEHRAAARALQGHRSRHIHELHDALLGIRAQVETAIDFAEHDIQLLARDDILGTVDAALAELGRELRHADAGALPPEGVRVALCGLPNAGKSCLFNALLGHPRAIVTDVPGTTRDAVAEPLVLESVRFRLYDTAGIAPTEGFPIPDLRFPIAEVANREAQAANRHLGIPAEVPTENRPTETVDVEAALRSRGLIAGTHIALVVVDASQPLTDAERGLWHEVHAPHRLLLLNKSDLPSAISDAEAAALTEQAPGAILWTSARTGQGLEALRQALAGLVRGGCVDASPADLVWNARHRQALRLAREALERARAATAEGLGEEYIAADLRDAHHALGAITGQVVAEDILDVIFAEFCIGK
jgi:tRNA modification GTPase